MQSHDPVLLPLRDNQRIAVGHRARQSRLSPTFSTWWRIIHSRSPTTARRCPAWGAGGASGVTVAGRPTRFMRHQCYPPRPRSVHTARRSTMAGGLIGRVAEATARVRSAFPRGRRGASGGRGWEDVWLPPAFVNGHLLTHATVERQWPSGRPARPRPGRTRYSAAKIRKIGGKVRANPSARRTRVRTKTPRKLTSLPRHIMARTSQLTR